MKTQFVPPRWLKALTSRYLTWEYPDAGKKIFLTFDDGPHPVITPRVMDMLAAYDARASFFVCGKQAAAYPELVETLRTAGHALGNHTWSHAEGWKTSAKNYLEEVRRCSALIPSPLFRPPYGRISPRQLWLLRRKNYQVIMWSVLTGDYDPEQPAAKLLARSLVSIKGGSIVVLHDSEKAASHCLFLLEGILRHFSALGYTFEALPGQGQGK